jgi:hypothetical protein
MEVTTRERLAELVAAAAYGCVLVLAGLSVIGVSDVALGHGGEIIAGVGVATWLAHLFAELLAGHVRHVAPLRPREIRRAAVDGSPILLSTIAPAVLLLLGRLDVLSDQSARLTAIGVGIVQLFAIGVFVANRAPVAAAARWSFAAVTACVGVAVVVLTVLLGH